MSGLTGEIATKGTMTGTLNVGQGKDGKDGQSVTHEWEGTTLKVTSASGTSSADLKGDTGVYIGVEEPTDPNVSVWVNPNGVETVASLSGKIIESASGDRIALNNAADHALVTLKIYGKTNQWGDPTPDDPYNFDSVGADGDIKVSITDGAAKKETFVVSTPNKLPGINVESGGNYTDEDGQQWLCDEIDFTRGVYVQRVGYVLLDGTQNFTTGAGTSYNCNILVDAIAPGYSDVPTMICSHCEATGRDKIGKTAGVAGSGTNFLIINLGSDITTVAQMKERLAKDPVEVLYKKGNVVETPLTEEQMAVYASMHTNKPNTVISNDYDAYMELSYVADTKVYIDNKYAELKAEISGNKATTYRGEVEVE